MVKQFKPSSSLWLQHAVGAFVFFFVFALNITWVRDADTWWHLKAGELIWNSGIPHTDPFSYVIGGRGWITFEWLSQVLFFKLFELGGAALLTSFKAFVFATTFWLMWRLNKDRAAWSALVILLAALDARGFFVERPFLFDGLFVAGLLSLLWKVDFSRPPRHILWAVPLGTALWANLHGGASVLAPALVALAALAQWIKDRRTATGFWLSVAFASTVALFVNPHGVKILTHLWSTLNFPTREFIAEWHPPTAYQYEGLYGLFLAAALASCALAFRRKPFVAAWVLVGAAASVTAMRHNALFLTIASPWIAYAYTPSWLGLDPVTPTSGAGLCLVLIASAWAHTAYVFPRLSRRFGFGLDEPLAGAVAFLDRANVTGRMFNEYETGGYLIFKCFPKRRVFVDGRSLEYGPRLLRLTVGWTRPDFWRELDYNYHFDYAIIRRHESGGYTAAVLEGLPEWAPVYWDDGGMVYLKRTPANEPVLRRYGYELLRPGRTNFQYLEPVLAKAKLAQALSQELDRSVLEAPQSVNAWLLKAYVLTRLKRWEEALQAAQRAVTDHPSEAQPRLSLGWVYAVTGDLSRAEETYRQALKTVRLIERATIGADILNNLGRVRERLGDLAEARHYYRKALRWNPQQGDARHNLRRLERAY